MLQIIEKNYVKPDESNKAQAIVEQKKRHKFIDKIHVKYVEREKRYWAEMENFGSKRIAINPQFYQKNEKLLESGIWADSPLTGAASSATHAKRFPLKPSSSKRASYSNTTPRSPKAGLA